ncbi:MAG: hypothetical protein ACLRXQ_10985 [Phascolarctobacterium faecium]
MAIRQIDRTFIVAQSDDSLFLVDQHAAHERILYDKLVASHNDIPAQQMLILIYRCYCPGCKFDRGTSGRISAFGCRY